MKIGFSLPAIFSFGNPGNGILAQARQQADHLRELGHEVVELNPWRVEDLGSFDVIQFFLGGFAHHGVELLKPYLSRGILVFAPIIDSNEPNSRYRAAAWLGNVHRKLFTIPGVFRQQARSSDLVVCRSRHEQQRIVQGLGIPETKTEIVLNGVSPPESAEDEAAMQDRFDLPGEYVLHVSAYTQPRKNVIRLLDAVAPLGIPLVIAGHSEPGHVFAEMERRSRRNRQIRILPFLTRDELNSLYARCRVFCLPSVHEGTGLAALEAASHGANVVITSRGGTTDYFAGYAEYVDPFSVESIRTGLSKAWAKPTDGRLRDHVLSRLSWRESARRLAEVYEQRLAHKRT